MIKFVLLLLLASCGFKPLYHSGNNEIFSKVMIAENNSDINRRFYRSISELVTLADDKDKAQYLLKLDIKTAREGVLIDRNSITKRTNVILNVDYVITEIDSGKKIQDGSLKISSGYNTSLSEFASYVSEEDATKNTIRELADEIRKILLML